MTTATTPTNKDNTLDHVLSQLGDFGRYQILVIFLFSLAVIMDNMTQLAFVFTTKNPGYRCNIPHCDNLTSAINEYNPTWLTNAVPYANEKPATCQRFRAFNQSTIQKGHCESGDFNRDALIACDHGYVYDTAKTAIANDFDIHCDENTWMLTIVGTIKNIGLFIGLPLAGFISDRYGRRAILSWGLVLAGISGIIRAFSLNYIMFLVFEFLDAFFVAGVYSCAFILAVEFVGPSKRVLSGTIISCSCAIGEVVIALLAWWISSWRTLLLVSYAPALLLISYLWITPESVRWLLSKGRSEEAKDILRHVARINKTSVSEDVLDKLTMEESVPRDPLYKLFQSRILLWRFIFCCFCWITCAFLFYGLTLNSVSLAAGNSYIDFILTSLIEIPAYIATYVVVEMKCFGRRWSQALSFVITGISSLLFVLAGDQNYYLQLVVYLLSKFGATAAFTVIYIITSEVFPTPMRHSMMGVCSMIGRIGSMMAPQMPLLIQVWKPLPWLLFIIMSLIAALFSLLFPETLNTKLPDTIEEAEDIGKQNEARNINNPNQTSTTCEVITHSLGCCFLICGTPCP